MLEVKGFGGLKGGRLVISASWASDSGGVCPFSSLKEVFVRVGVCTLYTYTHGM